MLHIMYRVVVTVCREYQIGMEIQRESSDHYLSRVVTFVARFQIENRTPFKIGYLQRHQLNKKVSKAVSSDRDGIL